MPLRRAALLSVIFLSGLAGTSPFAARAAQQSQDNPPQDQQSPNERKKNNKALEKELETPYRKWLDEDVTYIITPEERSTFLGLKTNEEREQFIEQFWMRRNPNPDSPANDFKEEHYRRIAYANEHYTSGIPGWKTDRGRIYIIWGAADEVDSHTAGETYNRPVTEGGGSTVTYAYEDWRYRYLEGIGENVEIEFVDPSGTGEFHLSMDPGEKDALLHIPNAGLTEYEEMGMSSKADRLMMDDGSNRGKTPFTTLASKDEFSRLDLYTKIQKAPEVKFKDLEAISTSRLVRNQLQFEYRSDYLRITDTTDLVPITIQIPTRQMSFQEKNGVQSATLDLFTRITTLSGRVAQTFEDTVKSDVPDELLQQSLKSFRIYQKAVPLSPGLYRMDIVVKDVNSGNVGVVNARLSVPRFEENKLSSSSLVLADEIQRVSSRDIGLGQFVLGDLKVRPRMDATFGRTDPMGIFLQVYNLKVGDKTHHADVSVDYRVMKGGDQVLHFAESGDKLGEHGEELTLQKSLTLGSLPPGKYKLEVAITDNLTKQAITPSAEFTVKETASK